MFLPFILPVISFASHSFALVAGSKSIDARGTTYPFSSLTAFGDEFSDNGNGSYAHGITGNPAKVYGYGTWTNGPVAVSYLADLLGVPLTDYAFGGCCGGGKFGATIDSSYTSSPAGAPSVKDQIANYTSRGSPNIKQSLHFIWAGQNDLSKHTDAFWLGDPHNTDFYGNLSALTAASVQTLLAGGAPYVVVANIYPKQLAPVTPTYLCGKTNNANCINTWGQVIQNANAKLKSALATVTQQQHQFGGKVIYYDAFAFVTNLYNNAAANGFTQPLQYYCDGDASDPNCQWDLCMTQGKADQFFWMNYVQPTTRVHKLMAADMKKTIDKALGLA